MRMTRLAEITRVFARLHATLKRDIAVLGGRIRASGARAVAAALIAALILTGTAGALTLARRNRAGVLSDAQRQASNQASVTQAATPQPSGAQTVAPQEGGRSTAPATAPAAGSSERSRSVAVSRGAPRPSAAPVEAPPPGYTWDDVMLLAHLIFAEANLEPYNGQVAVGAVVLNRTRSGEFPDTIAGVIYQPGQFESVGNRYFNSEPGQTAINAALDALRGWDPSGGALYFFDPSKVTNGFLWNRPLTVTIGGHRFTK